MTADPPISIQRWTNLSIGVAIVVAVLFVLLAAGPAFLSENILDRLTVLFIYVCLAVMWNALAGYGGMISAGQQAFFGLGGYLAIRLSEWGVAYAAEEQRDGWVKLKASFDNEGEAKFLVLGLGSRAQVVSPADFRRLIFEEASAIVGG